jgi:ribosomal protein S12 methylthiotransferase
MSAAPKIGFVSLGCPKALVDSERILTRLRGEGYATSDTHEGADAVVVTPAGFWTARAKRAWTPSARRWPRTGG